MKNFAILLFLCLGFQNMILANDKELKTEIKEVTVFLNGAQVFETGTVQLSAGETVLKIANRSPYLDEKSLQVKATGAFTILSVNRRPNFLENKIISKNDSLQEVLSDERLKLEKLAAEADVLKEKYSVLNNNKNLGGQNNGLTMAQLKQAVDFFEKEMSDIKTREIQNRMNTSATKNRIERLEKTLDESQNQPITPISEIYIKVSAERPTTASFSISYLVGNAGWFPKYDIRVQDITKPLNLSYKAEVWQNTGNDWKNVKLRFSNGEPNRSGIMPELQKWELTYARNTVFDRIAAFVPVGSVSGIVRSSEDGQPLPGVSVLIKGSTIGTTTDINGRYELTIPNNSRQIVFSFVGMTIQERTISGSIMNVTLDPDFNQLSEVVVTGYKTENKKTIRGAVSSVETNIHTQPEESQIIATVIKENQTTVEIEVEKPYSITSNGEKLLVDLKKYDLDAIYEYYAIPKIEKDAFLMAKITDWEKYSFLQGEANLYFEETFIGKSILEAGGLQDTLSISLGRDKSIAISREKVDQFSQKKTVGTNINESRGYRITIKNNKSQKINLTVFDQVPVSIVGDVIVSVGELSQGIKEDQTGIITWKFELAPTTQKQIEFRYEVKYPKKERVILD
ncbi:mucoidy inhibitor MuiA family protein [Cognataquiflexum aquatile]|uniref:mucoidy inhibitor MuiA family protein n=1 Tax=Cognataquiflexum aquatile TaxID=2249427 RepID=UPI000DEA37D8|nr:mucoidy inhibitor MuiA family protein [Cognataquiflexum aquatile]